MKRGGGEGGKKDGRVGREEKEKKNIYNSIETY